jgi:translocation and assembly module TamB
MPVSPPSPSPSGADAADRALDARPADDPISAEHPPVPGRPKRRRWLARTAGILAALVLLVAAGLAGLWVWSGSDQSLATLLRQAERRMPAGQTLAAQDVSGSLRRGGRIGALRWQNESLAVELRGIDIGWQLGPLLQRKVQLGTVRIADVDVTRTGPAKESEPLQPLQNLTLPVRIDVPFQVDRIRWAGPPETVATALAGRYRYDGSDHRLDIDGVDVANGEHAVRLDVRLQLQGAAPMALDAAVNARVRTPVPGSDTRLTVLAGMTAKGTLATEAARLAVEARVRPLVAQGDPLPVPSGPGAPSPGARSPSAADPQAAAVRTAEAMQAALQATIAPWLPQPVLQADARFQALDVARLYPDLPETLLDGQVTVLPMTPAAPAGTASASATTPSTSTAAPASPATVGWRIDADLRNALPGPWDRQRLPVESLKGRATFDGRLWDVPGMVVALGGGTIDLAGRFGGADAADRTPASGAAGTAAGAPAAGTADTAAPPAVWQGRATLARISPAALHTQLDPTPIGGTMSARTAGSAIDFDAALQPDGTAPRPAAASGTPRRGGRANAPAAASPIQALRLRSAVAQGRWDRQVLDLRVLRIRTQDADLQGQLRVQTAEQSGSGKLALALPGGQATVEGAMAPTDGKGDAAVRIDDAARVVAWLKTLPGLSDALAGAAVQGAARLDARWNGGWKSVQQRLDTGTLPAGARDLTLQATLAAPRLDARLAAAAPPPGRTSVAASASTPATATAAAAPTVVEVRDLRAELSGSLRQMDLSLQSTARADGRRLALQARGSGGMDGLRQFRAALASLSLRAEDPTVGGPWTLQLGAPLRPRPRPAPPRARARRLPPAAWRSTPAPAAPRWPARRPAPCPSTGSRCATCRTAPRGGCARPAGCRACRWRGSTRCPLPAPARSRTTASRATWSSTATGTSTPATACAPRPAWPAAAATCGCRPAAKRSSPRSRAAAPRSPAPRPVPAPAPHRRPRPPPPARWPIRRPPRSPPHRPPAAPRPNPPPAPACAPPASRSMPRATRSPPA